jgi:uncharacterized protein (DUF1800 family)
MKPSDLLLPFEPTAADPFDLPKAGHLLRRAGFGGSLAQRREMVRVGVERSVAMLMTSGHGEPVDEVLEDVVALGGIEQLRAYRIWRLLTGPHRLAERMSYFWHGHFATSNAKVGDPGLMAQHMSVFDRFGLGRFDDLLLAVSRDPAMIRWLDNDTNIRGNPNENYARELFELFALGRGHYTEADIRQAARAFTGWHIRDRAFHFNRFYHDRDPKDVFGERGAFGGEQVIDLTVRRPSSARFIARALLAFFVHPEPTDEEVDALGARYGEHDRHLGKTVKDLLESRLFYSERAWRSRVKSPADFTVGLVRSMGGHAAPSGLAVAMGRMGEVLLEPPSVEGWRGERAWMNSATWILRSNFASELCSGRRYRARPSPDQLLAGLDRPPDRADAAVLILLDGEVSGTGRQAIGAFADSPAARGPGGASALFHAVMTLPEAQLA